MMKRAIFLVATLLAFAGHAQAQLWNGVLSSARGMNWQQAGLPGGLPDGGWTVCTTLSPGVSAATINSAIASCASGHPTGGVVVLSSGTFNLAGGVNLSSSGHVVLRGAGPNATTLHFTSNSGASNGAFINLAGSQANTVYRGAPNASEVIHNVTVSPGQGATTLTLDSVSSVSIGTGLILNQCDTGISGNACTTGSENDNNGYFICAKAWTSAGVGCAVSTEGPNGSSWRQTGTPGQAWQIEEFLVTNVTGNVVTLNRPIHYPNWSTGQSPQVIVIPNMTQQVGVENLTVDASADSGAVGSPGPPGVSLYLCYQCWVSGVETINAGSYGIKLSININSLVQNWYAYGNPVSYGDNHGVRVDDGSMNVVQNGICQKISSCVFSDGPEDALVVAYNAAFGLTSGTASGGNSLNSFYQAHATDGWHLFEGNFGSRYLEDLDHGGHVNDVLFRNQFTGYDNWSNGGHGSATQPGLLVDAVQTGFASRYDAIVANVLGTPGVSTSGYLAANGTTLFANGYIYILGAASSTSGPGGDSLSRPGSTTLAYANVDVNTGVNSPRFNASEVPIAAPTYPNLVPTSCTNSTSCPASFYLASKPAWFGSVPFPNNGYDVSGGNLGQCSGTLYVTSQAGLAATSNSKCGVGQTINTAAWGGHANANPAHKCYLGAGGLPDGSGSPIAFNPSSCYAAAAPSPSYTWTPASFNFGVVAVGTLVTQTFTLTNTGSVTGNVATSIQTPGGIFSLQAGGTCNPIGGTVTLTAGATCTAVVGFHPISISTYTNNLVETDAPFSIVQMAALSGSGANPVVFLNPNSLNFGNVTINTSSAPQTVTLQNNGNAPLTITAINLTGALAGQYLTQANTCSGTIAPTATCTIQVVFHPTLVQANMTASLQFTTSAPSSPDLVTLTGTGVGTVSPSPVNGLSISIGVGLGGGTSIQ